MKALTFSIGENAGKLWHVLEANTEMNVTQLKEKTGIKTADLYAAIGWLAREGKIYCREEKSTLYFSNKFIEGFFVFG